MMFFAIHEQARFDARLRIPTTFSERCYTRTIRSSWRDFNEKINARRVRPLSSLARVRYARSFTLSVNIWIVYYQRKYLVLVGTYSLSTVYLAHYAISLVRAAEFNGSSTHHLASERK
jgi:hypothetical protein